MVRILIIDNDDLGAGELQAWLLKEGYRVDLVKTGSDGLTQLQKMDYDVAVVNWQLPDMEGTELLLKIPNNPKTVKIIITGFSTDKVGKKAADYGADDFLVKPVKAEELITTVRERLRTIQQER